ncbi:SHOCT domain-containing protein [Gemmatimonadota bacterium]
MGHEHFWGEGMWCFPWLMFAIMMLVCFSFFMRGGFKSAWWCWSDRGNQRSSENSEAALEILKKRYAKGEITQEEYVQMKKTF